MASKPILICASNFALVIAYVIYYTEFDWVPRCNHFENQIQQDQKQVMNLTGIILKKMYNLRLVVVPNIFSDL